MELHHLLARMEPRLQPKVVTNVARRTEQRRGIACLRVTWCSCEPSFAWQEAWLPATSHDASRPSLHTA